MTATKTSRRGAALAVLCLAAFTINLDTTIVNVALPSLVRELGATTSELQWVVDAYLLSFAALVLAGGSLGDRFGRKGALLSGFALFGTASAVGGLVDTPTALAVVRALMGVGAALIFPATLSIISNLYTERHERARAIGIWGAMTGLGVVVGPIAGGWLLEHFWWGSVFVALAPVAAVGLLATALFVPTSRDPATPPLDLGGLGLSTLTMGTLVFTIIEAPDRGWTAPATIGGFAAAAIGAMVFGAWERRRAAPDARHLLVPQPALHRRQRFDHHRLLRPRRLHLPHHPVLPVPQGLLALQHRAAGPARRASLSWSARSPESNSRCASATRSSSPPA